MGGLLRGISVDWTFANYYQGLRVVLARHYRASDMYAANLIGILDALDAGVTTTLDWCHNINSPDHTGPPSQPTSTAAPAWCSGMETRTTSGCP